MRGLPLRRILLARVDENGDDVRVSSSAPCSVSSSSGVGGCLCIASPLLAAGWALARPSIGAQMLSVHRALLCQTDPSEPPGVYHRKRAAETYPVHGIGRKPPLAFAFRFYPSE